MTSETFFGEKYPKTLEQPCDHRQRGHQRGIRTHFFRVWNKSDDHREIGRHPWRGRGGNFRVRGKTVRQKRHRHPDGQFRPLGIKRGNLKRVVVENRAEKTGSPSNAKNLRRSGVGQAGTPLALEKAGVETDRNDWIITNGYLETSQKASGPWAISTANASSGTRRTTRPRYWPKPFGKGKKEVNYEAVPWAIHPSPGGPCRQNRRGAEGSRHRLQHRDQPLFRGRGRQGDGVSNDDDDNGFVKMIVGRTGKSSACTSSAPRLPFWFSLRLPDERGLPVPKAAKPG